MKSMRTLWMIVLLVMTGSAFAADYAREKKWADEVVPGVVVGDPVYLEQANGHKFLTLYTQVKDAKAALVIVHGLGIHPDWGLIGVLRSQLPDHGYTTLSVQMPVLGSAAKATAYPATFPEAAQRLRLAVGFLKAKGYSKIGIVSHSMGSRMSYAYLSAKPDSAVKAWVAIGMPSRADYRKVNMPVLDLYGQNDLPEVLNSAAARKAALRGKPDSEQMQVARADHFFTDMDTQLVDIVATYLNKQFK
ncbi:MAG TPA: alpha/beta fold hydrolase [Sulfuriferula sp.]|nr:alpha/beta fold hydrolase [Sulfuriferula sp.]